MVKKLKRLPKQSMLELERAILSGEFVFNRPQKKFSYIQDMRKVIYDYKMQLRKRKLRERSKKLRETKYFSISFPGKNFRFKTYYGRNDKPVSSVVYLGFTSFSFNFTIPKEIIPGKNPKQKLIAAYEDEIMQYVYDNIDRLCTRNIIKQTVIRNKTSIKLSFDVIHKPKSANYTLKMCKVDKKHLTAKIKKHIKIKKGKKYYD